MMSVWDEYRDVGYMNISKLGDMLLYGYNNDFYFDEEYYKDYISKSTDLSDAFRIVYMILCFEDVIGFSDRKRIESVVAWNNPDEPALRDEVIAPFFELGIIKYHNIADIDGLVEFLNQYNVNEMIRENANAIFYALNHGFIVNKKLYYYSDGTKEPWPDDNYAEMYLYRLDLSVEPKLVGFRSRKYLTKSYLCHHLAGIEKVELVTDRIIFPIGHSNDYNWVYYKRGDFRRFPSLVSYNLTTDCENEYWGQIITYNNGAVIIQHNNMLYRISGNDIKMIYKLDKYEYAQKDTYPLYGKSILIVPVIRGCFVPYRIDFEGKYITQDTCLSDYMWYTIISLEYLGLEYEDIPYADMCHRNWLHIKDDFEEYKISLCTINNIDSFADKFSSEHPRLYELMQPLLKLLLMVGTVINIDTDISDFLLSVRNDFINSDKEYWNKLIDEKYELKNDGKEETGRDILANRFDDEFIIEYKYCLFVSQEYVDNVEQMFLNGKIDEYIGNIWFKDSIQDNWEYEWESSVVKSLLENHDE